MLRELALPIPDAGRGHPRAVLPEQVLCPRRPGEPGRVAAGEADAAGRAHRRAAVPNRQAISESAPRYSTLSTTARTPRSNARLDVLGPHAQHAPGAGGRQHRRPVGARDHRAAAPGASGSRFIGGVPMKRATKVLAGDS